MIRLALGLASLVALAEGAVTLARVWWGAGFHFQSPHAAWAGPLSHAIAFLAVGGVAQVLDRRMPGTPQRALALPCMLAAFSVLFLLHPGVHLAAIVLLSLGAGWQLAGWMAARRATSERWLGRVALPLLLLLAGTGLWRSRVRDVSSGTIPAPSGPSVLLLILDTVRASNLGLYGYARATSPALDSLGRTGLTFERAISSSPWTLPGHASLFTGRPGNELAADWEVPLDGATPTLAEAFSSAGYRTAGFVGNVAYAGRETGLARGFDHYEDYRPGWSDLVTSTALGRFVSLNPTVRRVLGRHDILGRRTAAALNARMMRWLDRTPSRPFFAFINYYDAHEPYVPPAPFDTLFGSQAGRDLSAIRQLNPHMAERTNKVGMSPAQASLEQLAYDQSIAWLDAEIGTLLGALRARGVLDETIVAITADHGEQFGELGLYSHGNGLYLPALHVPLILVGPGVPQGRRPDVVSTRHLAATLARLAGLEGTRLAGTSLLTGPLGTPATSSIRPARNQDPAYPSFHGEMVSATSDTLHLIHQASRPEELFDLGIDRRGLTRAAPGDSTRGARERAALPRATARPGTR